jgi:hypothetical protein
MPLAVPHTSYTPSCTMNSMNATALVMSGYQISSRANQQQKNASFTIYNSGSGDVYQIQIPVQDDGVWRACDSSAAPSWPWQLLYCRYLLDRNHNTIGFQFQWYCDDRDPLHAYVLSLSLSLSVSLSLSLCLSLSLSLCLSVSLSLHMPVSPRSALD